MEPKGRGTIEYLPELRRMHLLGTWVNKAASVSVYTGGHLLGARERMNEIVGTVAEPRIQRRTSDLLEIPIPLQYDPKT
jgi:hypothetical protein